MLVHALQDPRQSAAGLATPLLYDRAIRRPIGVVRADVLIAPKARQSNTIKHEALQGSPAQEAPDPSPGSGKFGAKLKSTQ